METFIIVQFSDEGTEGLVSLQEYLAEVNLAERRSKFRGWVSRLILLSSALYHTVLMLISLFLYANILFCLSKLNKNCNTRPEVVYFEMIFTVLSI